MEREKLKLTGEQARTILWSDDCNFEVVSDDIIGKSRWSIQHEIVIKRLSDGRFFKDNYSKAATENQDESPWEYTEPDFTEVFPKEKTIIIYE